ncbi:MAG: prepilin-type N-terminal cleavage/methylation domain-containing protein [Elusimicrobium sp.]|nr:prepilin-type N-terminal cleavage/methylation domain-containing protein [Elusimicrobium sp.]
MIKTNSAFTLIELLVVVLIIGILAAVALAQYQKSVERSRGAEAYQMLAAIRSSMERYYLETGTGPTALSDLDIEVPGNEISAQARQTANFKYTLNYSQKSDAVHAIRTTAVHSYELIFVTSYNAGWKNTTLCDAYDSYSEKLCVSLGGTYSTGTSSGGKRYLLK